MIYAKSLRIVGEIILFTINMLAKDKKSLVILLLMPFILIAVLGSALSGVMSGGGFQFEKAHIGIVDEDQSTTSNMLIDNGFNNEEVIKLLEAEELSKDEAEKLFAKQKLDGILYLHQGYEESFIFGKKDQVLLKMNPTKAFQADIIKQTLNMDHILGKLAVDSVNAGRALSDFPTVNNFLSEQTLLLEVNKGDVQEVTISAFQYYAVGMGVMYVLFTMFTGIGFVMDERQQGTLYRVKMTGVSSSLYYLSKSLAFMFISILQMLILFISSHLAFGVEFGDYPAWLFLIFVAYSLAISGLMLLLLRWIRNQNTLNVFFSIGVPVIAALGGSMIPVGNFPGFIEPISNLLPNRWAIEALTKVILNRPEEVTSHLVFLFSFALITGVVGIWQLSRREAY